MVYLNTRYDMFQVWYFQKYYSNIFLFSKTATIFFSQGYISKDTIITLFKTQFYMFTNQENILYYTYIIVAYRSLVDWIISNIFERDYSF